MLTLATQVDVSIYPLAISQTSVGIRVQPLSWWSTWVVQNTNTSVGLKQVFQDLHKSQNITIMNRIQVTQKTELGVDFYQGEVMNYVLGIKSNFAEKWYLKAKVGSSCDFEMIMKYHPYGPFHITFGLKGEYHDIIERQN